MNMVKLSDGRSIPCMGFGCYNAFGEEISQAVRAAIDAGYRYIDSAEFYKNEESVGEGLSQRRENRNDLFILSKAWPGSYENLEEACCRSLKNLQVEVLDAYLLHWPGTDETRRLKAYEQLLRLQEKGLVKSIGVSNFYTDMIDKLWEEFGSYPTIHEIECHPSYTRADLISWCRKRGIQTIAYMPINRSADLNAEIIRNLAEKYEKTPAQIVLSWHVRKDQIPIPKSSHEARIRENIDIFDICLTPGEIASIDALDTGVRAGQDPRTFPPESLK